MPFKDILVLLDDTKACEGRLKAALALAAAHGAHLTGLCVVLEPAIPEYVRVQIPREVLAEQRTGSQRRLDELVERYSAKAEAAGQSLECRRHYCQPPDLPELISLHARYADLLVMGQFDPDDGNWIGDRHLPEQVVLSVGRPVLMVPYIGAPAGFGKHALVAWDAGREAARAVRDALPLLEAAQAVTVLVVQPRSSAHGELPGADIALYLARHDIKAEVQVVPSSEIGVPETVLSRLADFSADVLVMGAYGHARWRELVLGGVTQHILGHMTVPVLMSH